MIYDLCLFYEYKKQFDQPKMKFIRSRRSASTFISTLFSPLFRRSFIEPGSCLSSTAIRFLNCSSCNHFESPFQISKMRDHKGAITPEILKRFQEKFEADPKNILALNACAKTDPYEVCIDKKVVDLTAHVFTHKVDSEIKPVTNQKSSSRCWMFAAMNVMRIPFAKEHQLEDFEFSQSYLMFWDKVERCNFFLHTIVNVLKRGEPVSGRLISFLLTDPVQEGGQWDMIVNLITRYGVIPKKYFPETFSCESSGHLNSVLRTKVREYTKELNVMIQKGISDEKLEEKILTCMEELYGIIAICIGVPPETFTWEYYNKNKNYCVVGPITPLKFYEEHVKPHFNVENKICLVNDPRPENPFGHTYTVDCLGNMVGGRKTIYINVTSDECLKYAAESIKNNEPVWFGCQVSKMFNVKLGIQDLNLYNFKMLFNVDVNKSFTKAERLLYGESAMDHAMTFTAVSIDSDGKPTKWRVENSWGDERSEKGYLVMSSEWFEQFGFEVVVDKQYVSKDILELLKMEPKMLPAWDPMGALAS
ncbi:bleomycin hydrolase-like [Uloborus diversus]|uniref:bleomycin hydrolase-like n=1 Tax=Uloborus diversus TaxID=327109 RepID=UPI00240A4A92|nr:bleomycin hydrolase-like [Uloborus diversus]